MHYLLYVLGLLLVSRVFHRAGYQKGAQERDMLWRQTYQRQRDDLEHIRKLYAEAIASDVPTGTKPQCPECGPGDFCNSEDAAAFEKNAWCECEACRQVNPTIATGETLDKLSELPPR